MTTRPRYLRDLVVTYRPNPDRVSVYPGAVTTSERAASILIPLLGTEVQEVLAVLYLDAKSQVLAYREIHRGTLDHVQVHPRDVYTPALLISAHSIILAHNHPSGDPTPSPDDIAMTRRMIDAGTLLDVHLMDHFIIGDTRYLSFKETGRL